MKVIEFPELEPLWGGLHRPFLDAFSTRGSAGKCCGSATFEGSCFSCAKWGVSPKLGTENDQF